VVPSNEKQYQGKDHAEQFLEERASQFGLDDLDEEERELAHENGEQDPKGCIDLV
jgi:hypothetical protein